MTDLGSLCLRREAEVAEMLLTKAGVSDLVTILLSKLFILVKNIFSSHRLRDKKKSNECRNQSEVKSAVKSKIISQINDKSTQRLQISTEL